MKKIIILLSMIFCVSVSLPTVVNATTVVHPHVTPHRAVVHPKVYHHHDTSEEESEEEIEETTESTTENKNHNDKFSIIDIVGCMVAFFGGVLVVAILSFT